jgi:hypothetical protein
MVIQHVFKKSCGQILSKYRKHPCWWPHPGLWLNSMIIPDLLSGLARLLGPLTPYLSTHLLVIHHGLPSKHLKQHSQRTSLSTSSLPSKWHCQPPTWVLSLKPGSHQWFLFPSPSVYIPSVSKSCQPSLRNWASVCPLLSVSLLFWASIVCLQPAARAAVLFQSHPLHGRVVGEEREFTETGPVVSG